MTAYQRDDRTIRVGQPRVVRVAGLLDRVDDVLNQLVFGRATKSDSHHLDEDAVRVVGRTRLPIRPRSSSAGLFAADARPRLRRIVVASEVSIAPMSAALHPSSRARLVGFSITA
jgi:hypothetical protein